MTGQSSHDRAEFSCVPRCRTRAPAMRNVSEIRTLALVVPDRSRSEVPESRVGAPPRSLAQFRDLGKDHTAVPGFAGAGQALDGASSAHPNCTRSKMKRTRQRVRRIESRDVPWSGDRRKDANLRRGAPLVKDEYLSRPHNQSAQIADPTANRCQGASRELLV